MAGKTPVSSEKTRRERIPVIGWREYVSFPDWGIRGVKAKIDTGARTSALHVEDLRELADGTVSFKIVLDRKKRGRRVPVKAPVIRVSRVKPSTGQIQRRYVVAARVQIGPITKSVEVSLVRRPNMSCRMLVGRTALAGDFLVDPGRTHLAGGSKKGSFQ